MNTMNRIIIICVVILLINNSKTQVDIMIQKLVEKTVDIVKSTNSRRKYGFRIKNLLSMTNRWFL